MFETIGRPAAELGTDPGFTVPWGNVTGKPTTLSGYGIEAEADARYAPASHQHSAADITSGVLGVPRGGTGIGSYTTGNYLRAASASVLEERTPAQVRSDIGAAPTTHSHAATDVTSGILAVARGGTGIGSYTTGNYVRAAGASTLEQRTPAQVLSDIGAAPVTHTHAATDITSGTLVSARLSGAYTGITGLGTLTTLTVSGAVSLGAGLTVTAGGIAVTGVTSSFSGQVTAANFSGSGATLTNLDAGSIATGTLPVSRGGTGIGSYTAGNYLRAFDASTLEQRTPAQVLSDIGAAATGHTHPFTDITSLPTSLAGYGIVDGVPVGRTLTIANGTGITGGGAAVDLSANRSWTIGLTGQALALHNLGTSGLVARTGAGTVAARTLTGTANQVTVTNGDGISGNPTFALPQNIHTAATPTFAGLTVSGGTTSLNTGNVTGTLQLGTSAAVTQEQRLRLVNSVVTGGVELVLNSAGTHWGLYDRHVPKWVIRVTRGTNDATEITGTLYTSMGLTVASGGFSVTGNSSVGGQLTATNFSGSGATLTNLDAGAVATGTLVVARGGTGIGSYTAGNYIRAFDASTLEQRTPAQVRADIGASATGHTHPFSDLTSLPNSLAGYGILDGVTTTGTGATGTWGISITGSAATLTTTRTLWGQNFNGSGNVSGNMTGVGTLTASGTISYTGTGNAFAATDAAAHANIGGASSSNVKLYIRGSDGVATEGFGVYIVQTVGSSTTAGYYGVRINTNTTDAIYTTTNVAGLWVDNITKGAQHTITNAYGLYITHPTVAATNWSIYTTGAVRFGGAVTVSTGGITVTGNSTITGTLNGISTLTATTFSGALSGNATTATKLQTTRTFAIAGDGTATAQNFNGSANVSLSLVLATVNGNVGSFGSANTIPVVTVNAKGLVTAVSTAGIANLDAGVITGGVLAVARGGTGLGSYTAGNYLRALDSGTLEQRTPAQVRADIGAVASGHTHPFTDITSLPTSLAGYGIVDGVSTGSTYNDPAWLTGVAWSKINSKPTTLSGYGITDALSNSASSTQSGYFGDIFLRDDTNPSHYLQITAGSDLTATRILTLLTGDAARTLTLNGNATLVAGTMVPTSLTLTIANGTGITGGSAAVNLSANRSWTIALTGQALALHNLATNGLIARTGAGTVAGRTITGTANQVTVTNGDGVSGNPTLSLPQNIHTAATPTFGGLTVNGSLSVVSNTVTSGTIYANNPSAAIRVRRTASTDNNYDLGVFYSSGLYYLASWSGSNGLRIDTTTGNVFASGTFYTISDGYYAYNSAAGVYKRLIWSNSNYTLVYRQDNNIGIYLGGGADPNSYYDNNNHYFRDASGTLRFTIAGATGNVTATGTVTATNWILSSDLRIKEQVAPIHSALDVVRQVEGITYWNKKTKTHELGFGAQHLLATHIGDRVTALGEDGLYGVFYDRTIPVLWNAVREQDTEVQQLKRRVRELEDEVSWLRGSPECR